MLDLLTLLVLCCSVEHGEEGGGGSPHCGSHPSCGVHHLFDLGLSVQSWFGGKTESVSVQRIKRLFWDTVLHSSRWHNCHGIKQRCNYWMFDLFYDLSLIAEIYLICFLSQAWLYVLLSSHIWRVDHFIYSLTLIYRELWEIKI